MCKVNENLQFIPVYGISTNLWYSIIYHKFKYLKVVLDMPVIYSGGFSSVGASTTGATTTSVFFLIIFRFTPCGFLYRDI